MTPAMRVRGWSCQATRSSAGPGLAEGRQCLSEGWTWCQPWGTWETRKCATFIRREVALGLVRGR